MSIPLHILRAAGLDSGDELKVELEAGRIVLSPTLDPAERRLAAIEDSAGALTGVFKPGDLERLRAEWR